MTTTKTSQRDLNPEYRAHDQITDWQECDRCELRIGRGVTTEWDEAYHSGNPAVCPRCAEEGEIGIMALPEERLEAESAESDSES